MDEKNRISDEELENVSGGAAFADKGDRWCKYCGKTTLQVYIGVGGGWSGGNHCICDLWVCSSCKNTNYWNGDTLI